MGSAKTTTRSRNGVVSGGVGVGHNNYLLLVSLLLSLSFLLFKPNEALASPAPTMKKKVFVSGAGGQTGQMLFRKMLSLPDEFQPIGIVRNEESKSKLLESGDIPEESVAVVDVTDADALKSIVGDDTVAFCICTSAKPAPTAEVNPDTGRPIFHFPNGNPELVDWVGQKNQIDSCPPGAHVVICSTMGGTDPNHPLNNLGKITNEDGTTSGGNIVKWKRKSEVYLMNEKKDLKYTIVHPGGLINEPGSERELVLGVDDDTSYGNTDSRTVPREDVAQVMLEAVRHPAEYAGRSFDLRAKPVGEGTPTTDYIALLNALDGKNCDYTLGEIM